jgi:hypothetical protein
MLSCANKHCVRQQHGKFRLHPTEAASGVADTKLHADLYLGFLLLNTNGDGTSL